MYVHRVDRLWGPIERRHDAHEDACRLILLGEGRHTPLWFLVGHRKRTRDLHTASGLLEALENRMPCLNGHLCVLIERHSDPIKGFPLRVRSQHAVTLVLHDEHVDRKRCYFPYELDLYDF